MNPSGQLEELLPHGVRRCPGAARRWLRALPSRTRQQIDTPDYHGLAKESIPSLTNPYSERGFGYLDYLEQTSYGISLTSPSWIRKQVQRVRRLEEAYFRDRGWDDHQDVYFF
jgi:hypothetical protein